MTVDTAKLRELIAKATPGPWSDIPYQNGTLRVGHGPNCTVADIYWPAAGDAHANASLIAESRNALPALLDEHDALIHDIGEYVRISSQQAEEIERKDAEVARLREALIGLLTRAADDEEYGPDHAVTIARAALSHSQADPTGVSAPQEA